jgi:hypothetical protein
VCGKRQSEGENAEQNAESGKHEQDRQ